jgi:hypothetical protein
MLALLLGGLSVVGAVVEYLEEL